MKQVHRPMIYTDNKIRKEYRFAKVHTKTFSTK